MKPGARLNTQDDVEHFRNNAKLHRFCSTERGPRLLLRGEGHARDGSASNEALSLIEDPEQRIVAIVINAIDASLKGDSQQESKWRVDSIRSLSDILAKARDHGRYVLFASDHGHVPADRLQTLASPSSAGARHRPYAGPGDPLQTDEIAFNGPGVYVGRGQAGAVLLATDRQRYGGAAHAGEHGGASLAEVVAPCVLLGWNDATTDTAASDLQLMRVFEPDWWHYSADTISRTAAAGPLKAAPTKKKPKPPPNQLGLPGVPPPPPEPSVEPAAEPDAFAECSMLEARVPKKSDRVRIARAVRFLIERSGVVPADAFAQYLGIPQFRVDSMVATFTEALNVDGYEVLRLDRKSRQLYLDREKLEAQFDIGGIW